MKRKYKAHIEFFNDNDTSFESSVLRQLWKKRSFVRFESAVEWLRSQQNYIDKVKNEYPCSAERYVLDKETGNIV